MGAGLAGCLGLGLQSIDPRNATAPSGAGPEQSLPEEASNEELVAVGPTVSSPAEDAIPLDHEAKEILLTVDVVAGRDGSYPQAAGNGPYRETGQPVGAQEAYRFIDDRFLDQRPRPSTSGHASDCHLRCLF
jgi:hypothetical protein